MRKIKYLLLVAIISFFVLPCSISASAPATFHQSISWWSGMGSIQTNEMKRGETYSIHVFTNGGFIHPNEYLTFDFDNTVLEIVEFYSSYGFEYNNGKIKLEGNKLLKEGFSTRETVMLWRFEVKVKDNAKLGKTKIDGVLYEIVCAENEQCENNNNNKEEIQKPNNPTQEDNINNENKDEDTNNDVIPKPDNDKNDNAIENENNNNQENNVIDKAILDDTKFYILTGLLGIVVLEMFVLIIRKTKKA